MMKKDVPVLLLTGYLGSGKTTLVNHILTNRKGIKFAVIVNDIGEVNVDASLIQKGGVVAEKDDSLVALQNGCICCTLKMNLVDQLSDLVKTQQFDYIVIEASGICEPEPIARTISTIPRMNPRYTEAGIPRLDCIVTVVDALRMQSEFSCGGDLERKDIDEEDIENLLVQQIEFCNIVLLNKVSEVTEDEMERVKEIIRHLNPGAEIIETDYAQVDLDRIVGTKAFDYERVSVSTGWVRELERETTEEEEREARADHHHHDEDTDDHHEHGDHHHHHDDDDDEHEHHHHDDDEDEHRWKNTVSPRLCITAAKHLRSVSSISFCRRNVRRISSGPRACAISRNIAICRIFTSKQACNRSSRRPVCGTPPPRRKLCGACFSFQYHLILLSLRGTLDQYFFASFT